MKFGVVDFHCDVLYKLQLDSKIRFADAPGLDASARMLRAGEVQLQCFAIFLDESLGQPRIGQVLEQISLYRSEVETNGYGLITNQEELSRLRASGRQGALLSLEGADGLEGNFHYLRSCYDLGVRFLGITWNYANWAADGALEVRNGGFTNQGRKLVATCHELGIVLDASHLSEKAFWELAEMAQAAGKPFIASHSNCYSVCPHPRNLKDDQIRAIVKLGGRIGLTFVPYFVKSTGHVKLTDLLAHIEHFCLLGAEECLMFGSDFDGIEVHIKDLENAGQYPALKEMLLQHYSETLVEKWMSGNALRFLETELPPARKAL